MSNPSVPSTMRAAVFSSAKGGVEKNIHLESSVEVPTKKPNQHLVEVIAAALNPVDFKIVEAPLALRFFSKPFIACKDIAARIVQPAEGSTLKPGQIVFGGASTNPLGGGLAQYAIAGTNEVVPLPEGVDPTWGAAVCIAGLTAYQSIVPHVKEGSNVFLNGGSGGTGIFGIQIAKAKGCYVVTSCSTPNVDLCKSLGADEVIDYKKQNVVEALVASGRKFDHVVDNVCQPEVYFKAHEYTSSSARVIMVGGGITAQNIKDIAAMRLTPGFLGGGKRKFEGFFAVPKAEELAQIGTWMASGQVKPVIDSRFPLEEAAKAFEKLKTGRARGKIIVDVAAAAP